MADTTVTRFDYVQTFFADPDRVNGAAEMAITSINLYIKSAPVVRADQVGAAARDPGISVTICDVENNQPVLSKCYAPLIRIPATQTYNSTDASTPTNFKFALPVKVATGRKYGIVVVFDDPFSLWYNRVGEKLVGTVLSSAGSTNYSGGELFPAGTITSIPAPIADADLTFDVKVARYTANSIVQEFVNPDYEFLTVTSRTGEFIGGEWLYKEVANATGNVAFTAGNNTIIGTGTTFTSLAVGDTIALHCNTTLVEGFVVSSITNNTLMTVTTAPPASNTQTKYKATVFGQLYAKDLVLNKLYLRYSNANSTIKFEAGDVVKGFDSASYATISTVDEFSVDRIKLKGSVKSPAAGSIRTTINLSEKLANGSYVYTDTNNTNIVINDNLVRDIDVYDGHVLSRSLEVDNADLYTNASSGGYVALTGVYDINPANRLLGTANVANKSLVVTANIAINQSANGLYQAPAIDKAALDIYTFQNIISNTYTTTDANSVTIDSEVSPNHGNALARHITRKVTFANNRFAEDVRVFMTAYRPAGTEIKVYTRVHNSADPEAADDKAWTPLEYKSNALRFSSSANDSDFVEYELGLPQYSDTANTLPGTFTSESGNTIIVAQGVTANSYVAQNDVVKLYNPLIPSDYIVGVVAAANTSTITLGQPVTNNNVIGTGFKVDRLKYYNIAFNNISNDNVARYYSSTLVEYDKFDSMQIKIVLLADTTYRVPKVDQLQVIGVSA